MDLNNQGSITVNGHVYTVSKSGESVLVSFTNIPSDAKEFEQVYRELLGRNEYTVPALIPMAMEIYARNQQEGEKCITVLCTFTAKAEMIRIIKDKFSHPDDPYCQRYLPAALLQGASNKNAYTPNTPYTVCIEHSVNKDQETEMYNGTYYFLQIIADGWDTHQRGVQVFRSFEKDLFQVFSCPATYTQCKPIRGIWPGLA